MEAILALEDGRIFKGRSFGAKGERYGEVVFNTSMTGYQEIITDPSYKGQIVTMTYPLIGNYGINDEDSESRKPFLNGLIVKECSKIASNWRSIKTLDSYLKENDIFGLEGIDTRSLTLHIRNSGAMKAVLSTEDLNTENLVVKAKASQGLIGIDLVRDVTSSKPYEWNSGGQFKVVLLDCGAKFNIMRELARNGCSVTVVPAATSAKQILAMTPRGIMLSNGPGDPAALPYIVKTVQDLIGKLPIFGICLGHQVLAQALGGKTYKLKFGHHGGNQPVKDLKSGKIAISVQNHGFSVDIDSLNKKEIDITHVNLNDGTLEGMAHRKLPIFSVQFHPEACPGPKDAEYLFGKFVQMMKKGRHAKTN